MNDVGFDNTVPRLIWEANIPSYMTVLITTTSHAKIGISSSVQKSFFG